MHTSRARWAAVILAVAAALATAALTVAALTSAARTGAALTNAAPAAPEAPADVTVVEQCEAGGGTMVTGVGVSRFCVGGVYDGQELRAPW
ncbi:hypothetical protein AB0L06_15040 [Spirillospora sp. NPDC052269]